MATTSLLQKIFNKQTLYYLAIGGITCSLQVGFSQEASNPTTSQPEFFSFDQSVRKNFSLEAHEYSNIGFAYSYALPYLTILSSSSSQGSKARESSILTSVATVNMGVTFLVKYLAMRPRPYTFHPSQEAKQHTIDRGIRSKFSFYSGHSSLSFTGATAGSVLATKYHNDRAAKNFVWTSQFAAASSAAILRVRAGKHYYSDIFVGAFVGIGIGFSLTNQMLEKNIDVSSEDASSALLGTLLGLATYFLPYENQDIARNTQFKLNPLATISGGFGVSMQVSI